MKEIIGDDYPTYEDSVSITLAERKREGMYLDENNTWRMDCGCTEANVLDGNHNVCKKTTDKDILLSQALHRLACIEDDIKIIARHIENNCPDQFEKPSLNEDGSVFADCAWHNISNIEIACDLNNKESLDWKERS
jgi:hypothetical protein